MPETITRCLYTLDGQGFDFSSSYKWHSPSTSSSTIPTPPTTLRANYTLDGQGLTLKYPYEQKQEQSDEDISLTSLKTNTVHGDDGLFRSVYDLGQRPTLKEMKVAEKRSFMSSRPSFFSRKSSSRKSSSG